MEDGSYPQNESSEGGVKNEKPTVFSVQTAVDLAPDEFIVSAIDKERARAIEEQLKVCRFYGNIMKLHELYEDFDLRSRCLKELADEFGAQGEYRALFQQAQLGKQYEKQLQDEVVRLFLSLDMGLEEPVLRAIAQKVGAQELLHLKNALSERLAEYLPVQTQLKTNVRREDLEPGYLI